MRKRILFEDNHLVAVNKLPGEISQLDKSGDSSVGDTIAALISEREQKPGRVYLVPCHRLDRPVSGVLIFAKTSKANSRMNALFREGRVRKRYWAIVVAAALPNESGTLVHHLVRDRIHNKSYALEKPQPNSKRAELSYGVVQRADNYQLLELEMETGRHHQIRAQLASIGAPIRGDLKYGFSRLNPEGGISLHARAISFDHPIAGKGHIDIAAPAPAGNLWDALLAPLHLHDEAERPRF